MVIIESDSTRRAQLAAALDASGIPVVAVSSIAEIERWPAGSLVVTEGRWYTPLWTRVGVAHVVVLADTPQEGLDACALGASTWLPRTCSADALVATVYRLLPDGVASPHGDVLPDQRERFEGREDVRSEELPNV